MTWFRLLMPAIIVYQFLTSNVDCIQEAQVTRRGIGLSPHAYNAIFKPIENRRAFQFLPMLLHPRSRGFLKLKSRNPFHHPLFYPNFFTDSRDIETLIQGIREVIRIVEQPDFQKLGAKLYNASVPGCEHTEFNTDEYWRCYIQHLSATLHHQIGTCKMGPASDATAVVDANGLVHGFSNLRVADISILPESPSGHTAAISFLIGEKISDSIRSDWLPKETNIQKLTRVRKDIDWLYQDPEQEPKIHENHTDLNTIKTTTHRPIHLQQQKPSADIIHVLHSLNMSALHEQSQQFKYSTIGDVGKILWGSFRDTKTIDFKSKLTEDTNSSATNNTNINVMKRKILKPIQNVSLIDSKTTEQTAMETGWREKKNITLITDTLPTIENVVNSTEKIHTEIVVESKIDEAASLETTKEGVVKEELDHIHSTNSYDIEMSDLTTQIIASAHDNVSTNKTEIV